MGKWKGAYKTSRENLREGDQLEDPGLDTRIILKWILEKWGGGMA
jgi:hypothetical protein